MILSGIWGHLGRRGDGWQVELGLREGAVVMADVIGALE